MEQQLTTTQANTLEQVIINGDLSKLSPAERVNYYRLTCESLGLNPYTKPFDYITLNGKLTLYAKKDATDQLRALKGVSIDDVDIQDTSDTYVVKVKGHDETGRSDVEIGVVLKSDMQKHPANLQMKAVTKAKRRLTLSLCGLGWLDETEIETIPNAKRVTVTDEGNIIDQTPVRQLQPAPEPEPKQAEAALPAFTTEATFLTNFEPLNGYNPATYPLDKARGIQLGDGRTLGECSTKALVTYLGKLLVANKNEESAVKSAELLAVIHAVQTVLADRSANLREGAKA